MSGKNRIRRGLKVLSVVRHKVLPVFFPRHCPFCGRILPHSMLLCRDCQSRMPLIHGPTCYMCGKPLGDSRQELCYDCRIFPKSFDRGLSLFLYNSMTRSSITAFKYHNQRYLADFFVSAIWRMHNKELIRWHPDAVIPIPIHENKRKKRGYNQTELIAVRLARLLGIPCCTDLLLRRIDTLPQKQFSPQARLNNLNRAFCLNPAYLDERGRIRGGGPGSILLIDDIYTTGATMESCTRLLKAAGIPEIYVYSLSIGVSRDEIL